MSWGTIGARRKALVGLVPIIVAAAAMPLIAGADPSPPHWKIFGTTKKVVNVPVKGYGHRETITFTINPVGSQIACRAAFTDMVSNPSPTTEGVDEMTTFSLTKCSQPAGPRLCASDRAVEVQALNLPWRSHLNSAPPPAGSEGDTVIEGVEVDFRCAGQQSAGKFKGSLAALVRQDKPNCGGLDPTPCAEFEFAGEPSLTGEAATVAVTGVNRIAAPRGRTGKGKSEVQVCYCDDEP
jgi:hypothetical protein